MLITAAQAQAAEATKAAAQAADVFLDRGVLGAACVLLLVAVCVLFWLLVRSYDRYQGLVERVVSIAEGSKASQEKTATAFGGLTTALDTTTRAVQDLAREAEGERARCAMALRTLGRSSAASRNLSGASEVGGTNDRETGHVVAVPKPRDARRRSRRCRERRASGEQRSRESGRRHGRDDRGG